jgi:hypothetical protein
VGSGRQGRQNGVELGTSFWDGQHTRSEIVFKLGLYFKLTFFSFTLILLVSVASVFGVFNRFDQEKQ